MTSIERVQISLSSLSLITGHVDFRTAVAAVVAGSLSFVQPVKPRETEWRERVASTRTLRGWFFGDGAFAIQCRPDGMFLYGLVGSLWPPSLELGRLRWFDGLSWLG